MKKIALTLSVLMLLMFSGCGASAPVAENGLSEKDISLCFGGQTYTINQKADGVISALGDEYYFEQSDSCAYEGFDKIYEYSLDDGTVVIFTIPLLDGEDTICQIETDSPSFSTPRGITIGSTADEVTAAYGTDCEIDGSNYYYFAGEHSFTDTPHIYFTIENGTVTFLSIYSARNHG